jgi:hypothetical protein
LNCFEFIEITFAGVNAITHAVEINGGKIADHEKS